jgi:glycosyltransferase involved in cell wall biosynthesis
MGGHPLRLLINGLHAKSGGGLTYLRNMLPLLAAADGVDLHLCLHDEQAGLSADALDGVTVHRLTFKSGFWRLPMAEQIHVPKLARRIGADVTFSPANYGPILAPNTVILLRNALGVAFVEKRPLKVAYWALVTIGTGLSLLTCRRAIAVSEFARRSAGVIPWSRHRIVVIPHGVSAAFSAGTGAREDFLLAVSDLYVQKNFENLIGALARLRGARPDIVLKIAGRPVDRDYGQTLLRLIGRLGLEDRVRFLGPVSETDLVELYRRCAVFVFPSTVETFGNPLLEAMACAAPIASSNAAAMPEVLGEAAVFFDPASVDDMAAALESLLDDGELRRDLSAKAAARARRFSWQKTARATLDVIRDAARP